MSVQWASSELRKAQFGSKMSKQWADRYCPNRWLFKNKTGSDLSIQKLTRRLRCTEWRISKNGHWNSTNIRETTDAPLSLPSREGFRAMRLVSLASSLLATQSPPQRTHFGGNQKASIRYILTQDPGL